MMMASTGLFPGRVSYDFYVFGTFCCNSIIKHFEGFLLRVAIPTAGCPELE
jgi:hypothetical protein